MDRPWFGLVFLWARLVGLNRDFKVGLVRWVCFGALDVHASYSILLTTGPFTGCLNHIHSIGAWRHAQGRVLHLHWFKQGFEDLVRGVFTGSRRPRYRIFGVLEAHVVSGSAFLNYK